MQDIHSSNVVKTVRDKSEYRYIKHARRVTVRYTDRQ